jgi:hypothetical protein
MNWKAPALIDYAAELKGDTLFITDFGPLEKLDDEAYLKDLAEKGTERKSWSPPKDADPNEATKTYQKDDIARNIAYCKKESGLGLQA